MIHTHTHTHTHCSTNDTHTHCPETHRSMLQVVCGSHPPHLQISLSAERDREIERGRERDTGSHTRMWAWIRARIPRWLGGLAPPSLHPHNRLPQRHNNSSSNHRGGDARPHVLILGSGWAGMRVLAGLSHTMYRITMVGGAVLVVVVLLLSCMHVHVCVCMCISAHIYMCVWWFMCLCECAWLPCLWSRVYDLWNRRLLCMLRQEAHK